jgi:hypothetical protein
LYTGKLQYVSTNERFSVIAGHSASATQLREHGYQMPRWPHSPDQLAHLATARPMAAPISEPIITSPGKCTPVNTRE